MNLLDKVVGYVSPEKGLARIQARAAIKRQVRRYEGATEGRRHSNWLLRNNPSVNQLINKDLKNLVARSRELSINNPYARKAPIAIANNVVGTGIIAKPTIVKQIVNGQVKEVPNAEKILQLISEAWKQWSDEVSADYNGDFNFYGMQLLAMRTIITSGEILAMRKRVTTDVNPFGVQILLLEGDYIDTTKNTEKDPDGGYTLYGVKFDRNNKRSGYWLFDRHPSESNAKSVLVPIADIIHVYDVERTGQSRGVPGAASTILKQRDLDDYQDAELVGKKTSASYAVFVTNGEIDEGGDTTDAQGNNLEFVEPGTVNYLRKGENVEFASPPQNPGFAEFVKTQERAIAAGYLMPYETLTGDLSNVNFSSGRMGWLEFSRQVAYWQYQMLIPKFCDKIFQWFIEAMLVFGVSKDVKVKALWTAPRREMIDPTKETNAKRTQMRAGLLSWQEMVRQDGYDPEQVLKEITDDITKFKNAGLSFDWSPQFEQQAQAATSDTKGTTGTSKKAEDK